MKYACGAASLLANADSSLKWTGYRELSASLHNAGYLFVAAIVLFVLLVVLVTKLLQRALFQRLYGAEYVVRMAAEVAS